MKSLGNTECNLFKIIETTFKYFLMIILKVEVIRQMISEYNFNRKKYCILLALFHKNSAMLFKEYRKK